MEFTTPCFIRKNTPELKKKLEDLGYKDYGNLRFYGDPIIIYCDGNHFFTSPFVLEGEQYRGKYDNFIDCSDNEELFLAIAALRNDTDYMQWFMIPNTKTVPVPGYCGQQGMAGYQRIVTSVQYHKYDRKDNRITDLINFEKEDGETILPRKLNIDELKLWFNQKIMVNDYKDDPNIKCYTNNIRK